MRIAAIDVGTNTALLLVTEADPGAPLRPLHDEQRFVRLGKGVDATRRIDAAAFERLRVALVDYRRIAEGYGVEAFTVGATSAARDAANRDELIAFVARETGLPFDVLSGEEEATWTFRGARSAFDDLDGPCLVVDIGGGSTELIYGDDRAIHYRRSLDVGTVRTTERFVTTQPAPTPQREAAAAWVAEMLAQFDLPPEARGAPLLGAAGTAASLGLVHTGAATWEALGGRPVTLSADEVATWRDRLLAATFEEVRALNPEVLAGRADVFPTGLMILSAVMALVGAPSLRVSPRGLRHGLALRYLERAG